VLEGKIVQDLISNIGAAGTAATPSVALPAGRESATSSNKEQEELRQAEEKEESDDDMGFGLFD